MKKELSKNREIEKFGMIIQRNGSPGTAIDVAMTIQKIGLLKFPIKKVYCKKYLYLYFLDPNKDYFDERKQNKKERINKNEFQRLKNISRSMKASGATNSNFIPLGNKSDEIFKKRQANNAKHQVFSILKII